MKKRPCLRMGGLYRLPTTDYSTLGSLICIFVRCVHDIFVNAQVRFWKEGSVGMRLFRGNSLSVCSFCVVMRQRAVGVEETECRLQQCFTSKGGS